MIWVAKAGACASAQAAQRLCRICCECARPFALVLAGPAILRSVQGPGPLPPENRTLPARSTRSVAGPGETPLPSCPQAKAALRSAPAPQTTSPPVLRRRGNTPVAHQNSLSALAVSCPLRFPPARPVSFQAPFRRWLTGASPPPRRYARTNCPGARFGPQYRGTANKPQAANTGSAPRYSPELESEESVRTQ